MSTQTKPEQDKAGGEVVFGGLKHLYVESDGNEVYICESGENDRLCTIDGYTTLKKRHKAYLLTKYINEYAALCAVAEAAEYAMGLGQVVGDGKRLLAEALAALRKEQV